MHTVVVIGGRRDLLGAFSVIALLLRVSTRAAAIPFFAPPLSSRVVAARAPIVSTRAPVVATCAPIVATRAPVVLSAVSREAPGVRPLGVGRFAALVAVASPKTAFARRATAAVPFSVVRVWTTTRRISPTPATATRSRAIASRLPFSICTVRRLPLSASG